MVISTPNAFVAHQENPFVIITDNVLILTIITALENQRQLETVLIVMKKKVPAGIHRRLIRIMVPVHQFFDVTYRTCRRGENDKCLGV